jgi:hypothetical protein
LYEIPDNATAILLSVAVIEVTAVVYAEINVDKLACARPKSVNVHVPNPVAPKVMSVGYFAAEL